jgi:hypothetical protein
MAKSAHGTPSEKDPSRDHGHGQAHFPNESQGAHKASKMVCGPTQQGVHSPQEHQAEYEPRSSLGYVTTEVTDACYLTGANGTIFRIYTQV